MFVLNRYVNGFNEHVSPRAEANTQLLDVDSQIDSKFEVSNTQKVDNKTKDLRHGLGTSLVHSDSSFAPSYLRNHSESICPVNHACIMYTWST